jgi:hypothetical protein
LISREGFAIATDDIILLAFKADRGSGVVNRAPFGYHSYSDPFAIHWNLVSLFVRE